MIPDERLVVETPGDPARDAIALALVMGERDDDAADVADQILAAYRFTGDELNLVTHLAFLVSHERDGADEFLFDLALHKAAA